VSNEIENKPQIAKSNVVSSAPPLNSEARTESTNNAQRPNRRPRRTFFNKNRTNNKKFSFKKVSVLIPLYNEEESIKPLVAEIKTALKKILIDYEILFIDDGSTDSSLNIIKELAKVDPKIKFISEKTEEIGRSIPNSHPRSLGMIGAIEFDEQQGGSIRAKKVCKHALISGLFIRPLGNVIYLWPPLTSTIEELNQMFDILNKSIKKTK